VCLWRGWGESYAAAEAWFRGWRCVGARNDLGDMATDGIEAVFLTTHNWGKTVKFFQALGFTIEFETRASSIMRMTL
jgi:hypothetical protein